MSVKVGHRGRQKQSGSSEDNRETRKKETLFYRLRKGLINCDVYRKV